MPENLKNVLLFMSSNGYLVPPSQDPSKEKLWSESWKRIDRFLPELRKDLALDVEQEQPVKAEPDNPPAPSAAPALVAPEEKAEGKAEEQAEEKKE